MSTFPKSNRAVNNTHSSKPAILARVLAGTIAALLAAQSAHAATFYWDNNNTTPGFGTALGTWAQNSTTPATGALRAAWTTDSTGVTIGSATQVTASTDAFNFGTAADGLGAGTITVNAAGLTMGNTTYGSASGAIVLAGGTINFASAPTITVNNASNTINSVVGGAATSFTKAGTGTLILGGANTYTGATTISAGTLSINTFTNGGVAGSLGMSTNASSNLVMTGGTLSYSGITNTTDRGLTLNGNGIITVATATTNLNMAGVIAGGTFDFTKGGGGTLTLSGPNTWTGRTFVSGGTLVVNSINSVGGAAGPLGMPTTAANALISIGTGTTTTTLSYIGTGDTTDRVINLPGTTGGATLNQSGASGLLKFTSALTATGVGSKTLTLQGSTAGMGEIGGAIVDNSVTNTTAVTKAGTGTWTLSGANTYTGGTNVNAGTLLWSGTNNLPITGTLAVSAGGTFSLADGTAQATTGATTGVGLTMAAGSNLAFDWNGGSLDALTTAGTATSVAGNVGIIINNTSPTGGGGTLITAASGLSTASYSLANNTNFIATLTSTDTTVSIGAQSAVGALTDAYWLGGQVPGATGTMAYSSGTLSNWASDATGTLAGGVVPGGSAVNLIFGATGVTAQSVTTGASMNLGSITFNDSAAVTLAGPGTTITLNSTSATAASTTAALATVTPGSAINVTSFANAANTISVNLALGANQTWNVASGSTLTVSGVVSGAFGLTKAGAGTVKLTAFNTFTGPITINGGTLEFSNSATGANNVYASTQININGASTLKISGASGNIPIYDGRTYTFDAIGGGSILVGTGNYNAAAGAFTIKTNGGAKDTIGLISTASAFGMNLGVVGGTFDVALGSDATSDLTVTPIIANAGSVLKTGMGRLTFTGVNTFSGRLTVQNGTLSIPTINNASANGPLGNNAQSVILGNTGAQTGTLSYTGATATSTKKFTMATGGTGAFDVTTGANTLTLSGVIDGSGTLTKSGLGTLTLSGANTYTGGTTLNQGTLTIGTGGTLGATTGALAVNNNNSTAAGTAAILNLATAVDTTTGSLSGTLATPTSDTNTATINTQTGRNFTVNQTTSDTYAGVIAGAGSFTLGSLSTNTLTLTGNNTTYTGVTTVSAGTLNINGTLGAGANVVNANGGVTNFGVSQTLAALVIADGAVVTLGATPPAPAPFDSEGMFAQQGEILGGGATQVVPEPGSAALLLGGLATLLGVRRRRA